MLKTGSHGQAIAGSTQLCIRSMGSPPLWRPLDRHLGLAPLGPFRPKNRMAAYVGQKYLLQWIAEPLDRPGKRQPFNRDDILHHLVARLSLGPHEPESHHLW